MKAVAMIVLHDTPSSLSANSTDSLNVFSAR
jgi:hypothetical protein